MTLCHTGTRDLAAHTRAGRHRRRRGRGARPDHRRTWSGRARPCSTSASPGSSAPTARRGCVGDVHPEVARGGRLPGPDARRGRPDDPGDAADQRGRAGRAAYLALSAPAGLHVGSRLVRSEKRSEPGGRVSMGKKVTVVGAGFYGSTTAQRLAEYDIFDTVVLTDIIEGKPEGLALDLNQSRPIEGFETKVVGATTGAERRGLRGDRGLRRRRHHRRPAAQAGHEPDGPARGQREDRPPGRREHRQARARTPWSSWCPTRSTR